MYGKNPNIKGLYVPRIIVFLIGLFQGRVLKTAGIDEKTGQITSSYIAAKIGLYKEYANYMLQGLEQNTKALRAENASLMAKETLAEAELAVINDKASEKKVDSGKDQTYSDVKSREMIHEKREERRNAIRKVDLKKQLETLRISRAENQGKINSAELYCREELDAKSNA
jgi:hypothetical protein